MSTKNKEESFKSLSISDKIEKIIQFNKEKLTKHSRLNSSVYLFGSNNKVFTVIINEQKFFKDEDYKYILKNIIKENIEKIEYKDNTKIIEALLIREDLFYRNIKDKNKIDLEKSVGEDSLIIYRETLFEMNLKILDVIASVDTKTGHRYEGCDIVFSNKPVEDLTYSKLDPDDNLKGILTDFID